MQIEPDSQLKNEPQLVGPMMGHTGHMATARASRNSAFSLGSIRSLCSVGSILSVGSTGSILAVGSVGSMLSIGSAGAILSIGSRGSILSVASTESILSVRSQRKVLHVDNQPMGRKRSRQVLASTGGAGLALVATIVIGASNRRPRATFT